LNEVHVWQVRLGLPRGEDWHNLSDDERERANRFVLARDRSRFLVCRGWLRRILGSYLGEPPGQLRFEYGSHGKPFLVGEDDEGLAFNVSHSVDCALVAVRRGGEIGIDVETIREEWDWAPLAERFFTPGERAFLNRLEADQQPAGFLKIWTRKESWIKARGTGLGEGLDRFDVAGALDQQSTILGAWFLHELELSSDCVGALAVEGGECRVQILDAANALPDGV
jgi:4'-phosphopantetheinyl transferase